MDSLLDQEVLSRAFEDLLKSARDEDRVVRDQRLNMLLRLDYFWNNLLDVFRDPITGLYRVPNWEEYEGELPPRLINIYRPHGEAIVAALSINVPAIYFHPDDADNPTDVNAARGYRTIVELLQLHNDAPMQVIKGIVTLFNCGTIFGYNYYHSDPKYGTLQKPQIELKDIATFESYCPQCGVPIDGGMEQPQMAYSCMECGYQGPVESNQIMQQFPQIVGYDETVKGTVCQSLYSELNVKIPAYARTQDECGYLLLEFLQSKAMLRSAFNDKNIDAGTATDWEGFAKIPIAYLGTMPENAANVACLWVRPWQFWDLNNSELVNQLVQQFPEGAYAIYINNKFMTAYPEGMDEHWTISDNPMGTNLLGRPLGENLATVQEIRAQLVEIEVQTAEFGIPETFVDAGVLDFKKYGKGRSKPGMMTQAKARSGKSLADAFHTTKPAILSQEVGPLKEQMDQDAQFVAGSFPSVYGGAATSGSKTASEYSQSRAAALQRLGTIWKIFTSFWAKFEGRSAVEFANVMKTLGEDERFTKRDGENFVNNWIRVSSLQGKIGRVEPESSEQLPVSWAAKKDQMQMLFGMNNEVLLSILAHPRNAGFVKDTLGLKELYVPGEDQRMRQLQEFQQLAQGIMIEVNPEVDDNTIHADVCKEILVGPLRDGLSEQGFQATMMHLMMHLELEAQQMAQQAAQQGSAPENEPQKEKVNDNGRG